MSTTNPIKNKVSTLKKEYDTLKKDKGSLLRIIDESELSESVYNSNAIENSTLTLKETEKILLEMEVSRNVSLREVFEAKNLARVMEYVHIISQNKEISKELILLLHKMLVTNIDDAIAGRFRASGEYVRVGTHIGTAPEHIVHLIEESLVTYTSNHSKYFLDKIAQFHLEFEAIHPFNDGNGRIGRVLINYQLYRHGFPGIIIRNKDRSKYHKTFDLFNDKKDAKSMEKMVALALMESLHKRIGYLKGETIITLADYAKKIQKPASTFLNAASRQTIPAFREKNVWKIAESFKAS